MPTHTDAGSAPSSPSLVDLINELHEGFGFADEDYTIVKGSVVATYTGVMKILAMSNIAPPPKATFIPQSETPDTWAPVNRPTAFREDVDRFRNLRVDAPRTIHEAMECLHLALELYEHAQEIALEDASAFYDYCAQEGTVREQWIAALMTPEESRTDAQTAGVGAAFAKSRTAASDLVDTTAAMVAFLRRKGELGREKAFGEKELSVARRRHATALAAVQALTFAPVTEPVYGGPDIPAIEGLSVGAAIAGDSLVSDPTGGDTELSTITR